MTEDGVCQGIIAWKLDDGTIHRFNAKMVVLILADMVELTFQQPAHTCTGDGNGMVARQNLPYRTWNSYNFTQQTYMVLVA